MAITYETTELVIPRGSVMFDPFDANGALTGEIPLGNCPGVSVSIEAEKAPHYSSQQGISEKDRDPVVRITRSGTLNCDHFSAMNSSLWISGSHEVKTQTATPVTGELRAVTPGRHYQLGATSANPLGVRNVSAVTVKSADDVTTYDVGDDYNVDLETGRVQIVEGGAIAAGNVHFGYTPVAGTFTSIKSGATSSVEGALRIVSANAVGKKTDWFFPKVSLTPNGELPLVTEGSSTDYAAMAFGLEVLKPANAEAIYCDGRPVAA